MNELGKTAMQDRMLLPQYQCHKKVHALKIGNVIIKHHDNDHFAGITGATIVPADSTIPSFEVPGDYVKKHNPQPGGYYVVYEEGYRSYSPAKAFEEGYKLLPAVFVRACRPVTGMTFGMAIEAMKQGHKVARAGWNGKGMWLKYVPAHLAGRVAFQYEALNPLPWIGMKTADEKFVPWLASQTDMLAEDWSIVA